MLAAATWIAYAGVRSSRFVNFDDDVYVTKNRHVEEGLTSRSIAWAFTTTWQANWHPLTWLSHMVDVDVYGLDPGGHHTTSLALHVANVVLLFLLFVRMTGALWRPALVAALFALHPLHVESVAWVAERKDVLSTLFFFLTLFAWVRFVERKSAARYALVLALFALGLMAKPMIVTLPFVLLLLDLWPLNRAEASLRERIVEKLPLFAISAASCVVTVVAQRRGGALQNLETYTLAERMANAALAYAAYLGRTFWPDRLAVFYPHQRASLASAAVLGALALLVAVSVVAARVRARRPWVPVGWLWFVGMLVPVIGLVQVGGQARADRYTYVPLIGLFVVLAWGAGEIAARGRAARGATAAACGGALIALLVATRAQVAVWNGDESLYGRAIAVTTGNWLAHGNLGSALSDEGKLDQAAAHLTEALTIRPEYPEALYNMGLTLVREGKTQASIDYFEHALRLKPDDVSTHNNLAGALAQSGRLDDAIVHLEQARRVDPDDLEVLINLGRCQLGVGRVADAASTYRHALEVAPGDADALAGLKEAEARAAGVPRQR